MFYYEKREEINRDWFAIEEAEDFSYPPHLHRWYEIIVVLEGGLDVVVNNKIYSLSKNDSLFIFPNRIHQLICNGSCKHKLCLIKPELIAHFNTKFQGKLPVDPDKHIKNSAWLTLFKNATNSSSVEEIKGLLYLYCSFFVNDAFCDATGAELPDSPDLMHRIFRFASENFAKDCTLADLSAALGYDYSYLSKLFSEKIGTSFTDYVNMLRIDRACYLLKNTRLPILDISIECGYGSLRTFNRNFSRRMAMTPRNYRKSPIQYSADNFKI